MNNILKLSPCTNDKPHQLCYVFDQIRIQIRGLESLGVETKTYKQLVIPIIMSKLPRHIRLQVLTKFEKGWESDELLALIHTERNRYRRNDQTGEAYTKELEFEMSRQTKITRTSNGLFFI